MLFFNINQPLLELWIYGKLNGFQPLLSLHSRSLILIHTHILYIYTVKSPLSPSLVFICWYKASLWWPAPSGLCLTFHIDFVLSQEMILSPRGSTLFMHIHVHPCAYRKHTHARTHTLSLTHTYKGEINSCWIEYQTTYSMALL